MTARLAPALAAALALSAAALPACAADDPEHLTLLLDWFVNPDHAPLVVAQEKGFFAEQGLDVEMMAPADPSDPPKLVAAEQIDLAVSYQPQLHMQVDQGLPLVRIGTLVATPLDTVIVRADSDIDGLEDLKGKRVGFSVSGFEDGVLGTMLETVGLTLDDVQQINVGFGLSPALASGQVDAIVGGYRNFEMTQLEIEGVPGRAFYPEEHGVPPYDELVIVAHADHTDDPCLDRFMDALELATQYLINHPKESWDLFVAANPDLNDELNRRAWFDTLPRFALRPAVVDGPRYQAMGRFLAEAGLTGEPAPVEKLAVDVRAE